MARCRRRRGASPRHRREVGEDEGEGERERGGRVVIGMRKRVGCVVRRCCCCRRRRVMVVACEGGG